jgi:hypothetical protein
MYTTLAVVVEYDFVDQLIPFSRYTHRYGLKVGEMSDIVVTDSGVHIILRTA